MGKAEEKLEELTQWFETLGVTPFNQLSIKQLQCFTE